MQPSKLMKIFKYEDHRFLIWPILASSLYAIAIGLAFLISSFSGVTFLEIFGAILLGLLCGQMIWSFLKKHVETGALRYDSVRVGQRVGLAATFLGVLAVQVAMDSLWHNFHFLLAIFFFVFYVYTMVALLRYERRTGQKVLCNKPVFTETYLLNFLIYFILASIILGSRI